MNFEQNVTNIIEVDMTGFFQKLKSENINFLNQHQCPSTLLEHFINGLQGFAKPNTFLKLSSAI